MTLVRQKDGQLLLNELQILIGIAQYFTCRFHAIHHTSKHNLVKIVRRKVQPVGQKTRKALRM